MRIPLAAHLPAPPCQVLGEQPTPLRYGDCRFVVGLRGTTHKEAPAGARPPYVFQHHLQATIGAFNYFRVLLKAAAPLHSTGSALPLICLPEIAVGEFQDTQFYMGSRKSPSSSRDAEYARHRAVIEPPQPRDMSDDQTCHHLLGTLRRVSASSYPSAPCDSLFQSGYSPTSCTRCP